MTKLDAMQIIMGAKLTEQFRCVGCAALLRAWGRPGNREVWSCSGCRVAGATIVMRDDEAAKS